ncbi:5-formyltetrahydrofolate cyclo-ligase [Mycobacterium sp. 1423905.2]|uniref:5-formyltetrahydrofolate cyclo-ligase n=1 Tax=Mycobacterium sp. 1423905.2 TaxID=1856859 RepID=UPI0007FDAA37|nr:5-formyltetrahydrofolate cyclo-ligase [Mycobacterium sp. 1423905.2]OBJ53038.1 5-formyltetrahydrofolate cyclo-ligase [Mycobacterium sp. 1423905.2]
MATPSKSALRETLQASRRRVADDVRAAEAKRLCDHLHRIVNSGDTVCAYVPVGAEPGSMDMLEVLLRRAARVLLPVARTGADNAALPLRWGEYHADGLVTARWGLLEPPPPWLPESALGEANLVLLPALAVDRRGVRLGRGRGFYDRSLALRKPGAPLVAIVRDEEVLDELPSEPHDVLVSHALTPNRGLIGLLSGE